MRTCSSRKSPQSDLLPPAVFGDPLQGQVAFLGALGLGMKTDFQLERFLVPIVLAAASCASCLESATAAVETAKQRTIILTIIAPDSRTHRSIARHPIAGRVVHVEWLCFTGQTRSLRSMLRASLRILFVVALLPAAHSQAPSKDASSKDAPSPIPVIVAHSSLVLIPAVVTGQPARSAKRRQRSRLQFRVAVTAAPTPRGDRWSIRRAR